MIGNLARQVPEALGSPPFPQKLSLNQPIYVSSAVFPYFSRVHWNGTVGRGSEEIFVDFRFQLAEAHADAYII